MKNLFDKGTSKPIARGKLTMWEVPDAEATSALSPLFKSAECGLNHVITAGAHSIRYDHKTDMPWGPPLYSVAIVGPSGSVISRRLKERLIFVHPSPYQSQLGLCVFVEWLRDLKRASVALHVVDLARGKIVRAQKIESSSFVGWRGGTSSEFIVQEFVSHRCSNWYACDARAGFWPRLRRRLLFRGGTEGHISADGRYLLVLSSRTEVFVALISIDSGTMLDLKKGADFETFVQKVTVLETVSFDPQATRLTSMLNCAMIDRKTARAGFEKLIMIEVGNEAEDG